jgi:hypothetical protein
MIILDTCVLIYDALTPDRLSDAARDAIERAEATETSLAAIFRYGKSQCWRTADASIRERTSGAFSS